LLNNAGRSSRRASSGTTSGRKKDGAPWDSIFSVDAKARRIPVVVTGQGVSDGEIDAMVRAGVVIVM